MSSNMKAIFKQSRFKIVIAIMSGLTLLWIMTLFGIYFFSYAEISSTNRTILEEYAKKFELDKPFEWDKMRKPMQSPRPNWNENQLKIATIYSVVFSYDHEVMQIRNDPTEIYSEDELEEIAKKVLDQNRQTGKYGDLTYYKENKQSNTLVAFMDNTILSESMNTLFRYTLMFGIVIIFVLYFLAAYLAKKIIEPLEENDQKQRQFISDAGHELKTPISIINANAELLAMELKDNQWLSNIQYENERMGNLVIQLLELARTESVLLPMGCLDLSHLVIGEILVFESIAYERCIQFKDHIENGLCIQGNETQLRQLMTILLDNAMEHSYSGKEIDVKLVKARGHIKLSVINEGEEIPFEQRKNLFERFYRCSEARTGDHKHYGLGLAIAKAIVEVHRGKIDVKCYDGYVAFEVSLPAL